MCATYKFCITFKLVDTEADWNAGHALEFFNEMQRSLPLLCAKAVLGKIDASNRTLACRAIEARRALRLLHRCGFGRLANALGGGVADSMIDRALDWGRYLDVVTDVSSAKSVQSVNYLRLNLP